MKIRKTRGNKNKNN